MTETQTPTQCSHGQRVPTQEKQQAEFLGFLILPRVGQSVGVEARGLASRCESQMVFSRPYFRMSNFVNSPVTNPQTACLDPDLKQKVSREAGVPNGLQACDKGPRPGSSAPDGLTSLAQC